MIQLFLAIPAVDATAGDMELSYLKSLNSPDSKTIEDILVMALRCVNIVSLDNHDVLYDQSRLCMMIRQLKENQKKSQTKDSPDVQRLMKKMTAWQDFNNVKDSFASVKVNDVVQSQGVICAYFNLREDGKDVVIDVDAINGTNVLRVEVDGNVVNVDVIDAAVKSVYAWFANHRNPVRKIDQAYEKHSDSEKKSKKGIISACTYETKVAEDMLKWAVGSKTNPSNRMYFHDKSGNKLLVFWNEDGKDEYYHVYEVSEDNKEEIQKIWKYKDGRELMSKIEAIAELFKKTDI